MIYASDAFKISKENSRIFAELDVVEKKIREAANLGKTAVEYTICIIEKSNIDELIRVLNAYGYKCCKMIEKARTLRISWGS